MRWHRKLRNLLPLRLIEKQHRPKQRVLLQLEELETRALLSAGSAAGDVHLLLSVAPQQASPQQTSSVSGYTPSQIQSIYGFNQIAPVNGTTIDGAGETIAIVDAYYDPTIVSDVSTFSTEFGLPQFNTTGGPTLKVVTPSGAPPSSLSQDSTGGWNLETSLDVEWAHAMAPDANILLVETPDESNSTMFSAAQWAASQPGVVVVSMSWGTNEFSGESSNDSYFIPPSGKGVTFVAASGDNGAGAIYPASSPYVLAVGGTTLGGSTTPTAPTGGLGTTGFGTYFARSASAQPGGGLYSNTGSLTVTPAASTGSSSSSTYPGESAWSGSGGGPSQYEGYPSYQYDQSSIAQEYGYPHNVEVTNYATGVTSYYSSRMTPDVAYNADPNTGYAVYDSTPSADYGFSGGWGVVGGTSAGAPQWSAIVALADQERAAVGQAPLDTNEVLNQLYNALGSSPTNSTYTSIFHDITTGSNGYSAGPGYDLATGLGTPIANNLVPYLASTTIPLGQLPTIQGSGYGGASSGTTAGFGSTSFPTTYYGFTATGQPGGGLYAGAGSLSIPPASQGANGPSGQTSGAPQMTPAAPLTFSISTMGVGTASTATGENNFVGNLAPLMPASPSAMIGSSTPAASMNAPATQANALLGATAWNGSEMSWRLSSLGLPGSQVERLADDLSANGEDGIDPSSGDVIADNTNDSSGEDLFLLDFTAGAYGEDLSVLGLTAGAHPDGGGDGEGDGG